MNDNIAKFKETAKICAKEIENRYGPKKIYTYAGAFLGKFTLVVGAPDFLYLQIRFEEDTGQLSEINFCMIHPDPSQPQERPWHILIRDPKI